MAANPIPAGIDKDQAFGMAQTEMEYRVELFNRYRSKQNASDSVICIAHFQEPVATCPNMLQQMRGQKSKSFLNLPILRYKESELNMGENSCIDRCVSKYWQVNGMIGQLLSAGKPPM
uniref:Mitochondrial import inner membrane translocase subunit n=1 Tax=Tarenaya spinosa TaxID=228870 RepID=B2BXR3_9ROSI|nr:ZincFl1 [Tarenaya spinosa]